MMTIRVYSLEHGIEMLKYAKKSWYRYVGRSQVEDGKPAPGPIVPLLFYREIVAAMESGAEVYLFDSSCGFCGGPTPCNRSD